MITEALVSGQKQWLTGNSEHEPLQYSVLVGDMLSQLYKPQKQGSHYVCSALGSISTEKAYGKVYLSLV